MSNKRKHKTLTLKDKMAIITMLDTGESMSDIAQHFGIGRSTIYDIKLRRSKIIQHVNISEERKTLKFGRYPELDSALYDWFLEERAKHNIITGDVLKEKAKEIYLNMTGKEFKASSGWLDKFKKRFCIKFNVSAISGEKSSFVSRDEDAMEKFIEGFKEKVAQLGLTAAQLYCTDASALFWGVLQKPDVWKEGMKKPCKDYITFMPCSNSTGTHKLDLLVIGKEPISAQPVEALKVPFPVTYKHQPNSWVTREIFTEWFHDEFVPNVRSFTKTNNLPEKALLILDEAPGYPQEYHLKSNDWMIQAIFIPVDYSPWSQPMDKNLMFAIKGRYRKKILLDVISKGGDMKSNLINLQLSDAIIALADSWNSLSSNTIRNSWKKLCKDIVVSQDVDEDKDLDHLLVPLRGCDIKEEDVKDWLLGNIDEIPAATDDDIFNNIVITVKHEDPLTMSTIHEKDAKLDVTNIDVIAEVKDECD